MLSSSNATYDVPSLFVSNAYTRVFFVNPKVSSVVALVVTINFRP